ncbi:hypothetical protein NCC78_05685 [Micromonospora phytophila]|uniref:hypothetical protein n=1 Tax=Micromonospora phytophila TaxID=709888 RepID=UPI00203078E7|nr:hypothetical protein [Micromonospora phytophila]MCM0674183.1 hypothetical protein [Micromonospora phytophila]
MLLVVVGAFTGVVVASAPAAAEETVCGPWSTEQDMLDTTGAWCRSTWLVDPGRGNLVSRQQLLDNADLYARHGFSRQWLWYAPERVVTVAAGSPQEWVACPAGLHYGGACPTEAALPHHPILRNFTAGPVQFHVLEYGGSVIARACGNFWHPPGGLSAPVPWLSVEKYDDRNRNGARDAGEGPLAGWQFRISRIGSRVGQANAHVGTVATGGSGQTRFDFNGAGPGTYLVEEIGQDGWAPTTPASRVIEVPEGVGDGQVAHVVFGNAETRADLVKAEFGLVAPPQRLEADEDTDLTVRAVLRNDGPADVTATDTLTVTVPDDCTAEPGQTHVSRQLARGQATVVDFRVRVRCSQPSFHPMTFTDQLNVATGGVIDPDLIDNTVAFEHVFPVFHRADVQLSGTAMVCPPRADVGERFQCTVSAVVTNAGPYGPVTTDVTFGLQPPADCEITSDDARQTHSVPTGQPQVVSSTWQVTCAQRSYHPTTAVAAAVLDHLHVEDPIAGNASGGAASLVEIFEPADLSVDDLTVRCTERESTATASACTAKALIRNAGPATAVATRTALTINVAGDCDASADGPDTHPVTLDRDATAVVTTTWRITCTSTARHSATVAATVVTDEPHAEDRAAANNTTRTVWNPADVKPRSLPSAVNITKDGVLPFAVLSTADVDALTDVDRASLRFGRTGTENSVISCAADGEDVNDDGRLDLICRADTAATDITCGTTVLLMTGQLTDGTRLAGEDDVKVVGCRT